MPKNALLEIGLEEVPARFMSGFLLDLKKKAEEKLAQSRLKYSKVETLGTLRRLTLYIENLAIKQEDIVEEIKGPSKSAAFDEKGNPTKAAQGFAKKQGVKLSDLEIKSVGKTEFVFAKVKRKGLGTPEVLTQLFPDIITLLYFPLSMRWGTTDLRFIRPIHWILALYEKKIIKFELGGIKSGNKTYGHRFFDGGRPIVISSKKGIDLKAYEKILLGHGVVVDQNKRKEKIKVEVKKAAKGRPLIEEDLLEEVNYLVENPVAAIGKFNSDYLKLPKEVLIITMKKNQKYFPVLGGRGELLPSFVVVTDGTRKKDIKGVVQGNERVLTARLSDAEFFFKEDKKVALKDRVGELKKVAFYEKLGSMFEKKERIKAMSSWFAKELELSEVEIKKIEKIAELSKADLVTQMVFEFSELQGIMGREYALAEGEEKAVAQGIFEHYLPRHPGDDLPTSIEGTTVGLADKFDSIIGCFSVQLIPSGSEDPYMLRRQAHSIIQIILKKKLDISLEDVIERCYKLYEPVFLEHLFKKGETGYKDFAGIKKSVLDFLAQRLKGVILEEGVRYDVADASLSMFNSIVDVYEKSKVVMKYLGSDKLKGIVLTSDRIMRLAKEATRENIIESDFAEDGEKSLHDLYLKINWAVGEALGKRDFREALEELAKMTAPVDKFFVDVLVMHKDEKLKLNRLALLKNLERMYLEVADFPKIVI